MRILILVDCYYPGVKASAKLIHDLGVEFRRLGNEITVVTPNGRRTRGLEISVDDGLRVVSVGTGTVKHRLKVIRGLQESRLSSVLWRKAKRFFLQNPCDLIVFYSPTIFFGALVRRLKTLWNCPAYLILRDIFPKWAVDTGVLRNRLIHAYFRRKELEQYSAADIIGVQSPGDLEYFSNERLASSYRLDVLYNWTSLDEPELRRTNYRTQLGLHDKVVFFYGGNIGLAQDMDNIIRLAETLSQDPQIHFLLVGEGSEAPRLKSVIAAKGLRNIQILPAVDQNEYLSMLSEFDVGLISLDRRLKTNNMPGKLLGYLFWGMPVLASINPGHDLFDILQKNEAGFCFANGDDKDLSAAALRLAHDPELRVKMGKNSRKLIEGTFSVKAAAQQIIGQVQRVVYPHNRQRVRSGHDPTDDLHTLCDQRANSSGFL